MPPPAQSHDCLYSAPRRSAPLLHSSSRQLCRQTAPAAARQRIRNPGRCAHFVRGESFDRRAEFVFEDVYLNGSNFTSTSTARVNGSAVDTTFVSPTVLRARIPAANLDTAVPAFIDVMQQSGVLSGVVRIDIVAAAPALIRRLPTAHARSRQSQHHF